MTECYPTGSFWLSTLVAIRNVRNIQLNVNSLLQVLPPTHTRFSSCILDYANITLHPLQSLNPTTIRSHNWLLPHTLPPSNGNVVRTLSCVHFPRSTRRHLNCCCSSAAPMWPFRFSRAVQAAPDCGDGNGGWWRPRSVSRSSAPHRCAKGAGVACRCS